jgi:drug/metabolite transporter (DMT)-like permease
MRRMAHDLMFAFLAGVSMAAYSIFLRLASPDIHPALGATIVTGVAFLANLALTLTMRATGSPIVFTPQSIHLVVLVGVAAACADFFTLSAYASGLKVTSSFMIGGTSTVLILLIGFIVLREPFTWMKLFAVGLIVSGIFVLQREGI